MIPTHRKATHPGVILELEFLTIPGLRDALVDEHLPVDDLINQKLDVTARVAEVLARVTQTSPEFWLNLQSTYDASVALTS